MSKPFRSTHLASISVPALAALAVAAGSASSSAQVAFHPIPAVGGPFPISIGAGLSADGQVVVGETTTDDGWAAFRWRAQGGMQLLGWGAIDGAPVRLISATAASADGSVVLAQSDQHTFRWIDGAEPELVGPAPTGAIAVRGQDITDDGQTVVGTVQFEDHESAFRWSAGAGFELLGPLPALATGSRALGVSGDGSVIVGSVLFDGEPHPFTWRELGGYTPLEFPAAYGREGAAYDASAAGSVVVGNARFVLFPTPARWSTPDDRFQWIGDLPGGAEAGTAFAVSADGSVVAGSSSGEGGGAFIWQTADRNVRSLSKVLTGYGVDLGGRALTSVRGVSADGKVLAGYAFRPDGLHEAFVARLDPAGQCPCNFDDAAPVIDERDVAAFVSAWFEQDPATDFNGDALFDIHDILDFLDCWFPAAAGQPCSNTGLGR